MAISRKFDKTYNILEYEVDPTWRNYISEDYKVYRKKWEAASKGFLFNFPLCVEIESSYLCNLKCPMCTRQTLGTFGEGGFIAKGLYSKILSEAGRYKMPAIMLDHEAEPLTNPDIPEMVKKAKEAGILDIWMHTNANLLTKGLSEQLIENGLTRINFSIDASIAETYDKMRPGGDFEKVLKNVMNFLKLRNRLKKKYIRTRVSFAVQDANKSEKESFFNFWKDKVNVVTFQRLVDFNKFKNQDKNLRKCNDGFICYKLWQLLIIRYNGDIVPCSMPFRHYDTKDYLLGNLHEQNIKECWDSPKLNKIRKLHMKKKYHEVPFCKDCVVSFMRID